MAHIVHCRWCKEEIDKDKSNDWIMPSKNWYYHKKCYKEKQSGQATFYQTIEGKTDDVWLDAICQFLQKDLKISIQYDLMRPAWDNLLKKGYKAKGVYFATIYAFQIKRMDPNKSLTHLGIVPYVYNEANEYFNKQSKINKGLYNDLIKQMQDRANRPTKIVTHNKTNKKLPRFNLDDIGGEDEL